MSIWHPKLRVSEIKLLFIPSAVLAFLLPLPCNGKTSFPFLILDASFSHAPHPSARPVDSTPKMYLGAKHFSSRALPPSRSKLPSSLTQIISIVCRLVSLPPSPPPPGSSSHGSHTIPLVKILQWLHSSQQVGTLPCPPRPFRIFAAPLTSSLTTLPLAHFVSVFLDVLSFS